MTIQTDFNIDAFGAVADGKTINTKAIQAAVDACAAAGGGTVLVPAGVYRSGPIMLRDNIEFRLGPGSLIRGSRNMADYPCLDFKARGYHIDFFHASLLTGIGLKNVSITGSGAMDGEGDVWWRARDEKQLAHGRPFMIYLCDCDHAVIQGVELRNSPCWTILPLMCRDLVIDGVTILNPWKPYFNCDGINPHSCRDVRITNCFLDTGDDGITLKSVPEWFVVNKDLKTDYAGKHIPCENIVISNCIVRHAHGGVTLGAEVIGGIRNVAISNCVFEGTRAGIRINRYPWPGGYVENVRVDNVVMRRVGWVFDIKSHFDPAKMEDGPGREDTPVYRSIHFSNITATQAQVACEAWGLPEMPIRDLSFSNVRIEADMGFDLRDADNVLLDNVEVTCRGVPCAARDVNDLELRRFNALTPPAADSVIQLTRVQNAWTHGCTVARGTGVFVGLVGDGNDGIVTEANRLADAAQAQAEVTPANEWNVCTHAYSGARWIRDTGASNTWLPVSADVMAMIRREWTEDQIDRIYSISRVEPNARDGAEVAGGEGGGRGRETGEERAGEGRQGDEEKRRIYIVEARDVAERLVIFEDGELLRRIDDPDFHAYKWKGM